MPNPRSSHGITLPGGRHCCCTAVVSLARVGTFRGGSYPTAAACNNERLLAGYFFGFSMAKGQPHKKPASGIRRDFRSGESFVPLCGGCAPKGTDQRIPTHAASVPSRRPGVDRQQQAASPAALEYGFVLSVCFGLYVFGHTLLSNTFCACVLPLCRHLRAAITLNLAAPHRHTQPTARRGCISGSSYYFCVAVGTMELFCPFVRDVLGAGVRHHGLSALHRGSRNRWSLFVVGVWKSPSRSFFARRNR